MSDFNILTVDSSNVDEYGFFCVKNKKHPGYVMKRAWLEQRFREDLRIKLILTEDYKQAGFVEYVPGENTWRIIDAPDSLVIQCLWVDSNKFPYNGMASVLIHAVITEAKDREKSDVAVVTSDGSWMAARDIFLKNGFQQVDEAAPHFQLLVHTIKEGGSPGFPKNWTERLDQFDGLQLLYTNQCPYVGKAVQELPPVADRYGIDLQLVEFNHPAEAREQMPSPYGVMNLVYDGQLLADHPISATRFRNILHKDLNLRAR